MPNPADPQDFNRYSYVRNNPLKYTDPSGHWYYDPGCQCLVATDESAHQTWIDPLFNGSRYSGYTETRLDDSGRLFVPSDGGKKYCQYADCDHSVHAEPLVFAAAIAFEPVDWAVTFNDWARGDFSAWDLVGLLPLLSGRMDDIGGTLGFAKKQRGGPGSIPGGRPWQKIDPQKVDPPPKLKVAPLSIDETHKKII